MKGVKIFHSYEEADDDYEKEVLSMSPAERVATVEALRRRAFMIKNVPPDYRVDKSRILIIRKSAR